MLYLTFADNNNNHDLHLYVGGITANNTKTISNCLVANCTINADAPAKTDSGDDNYGWLGGICAKNSGTLSQCAVKTNVLYLDVRGDGYPKLGDDNIAYPRGIIGSLVAETSGSLTECVVVGNTETCNASKGGNTKPTHLAGIIIGLYSGGSIVKCYANALDSYTLTTTGEVTSSTHTWLVGAKKDTSSSITGCSTYTEISKLPDSLKTLIS
ncbi:MAG: hypothetical protein E7363_05715 [Clostridiales bacterium]|nr:hypothetical protein [Clostridiales bacterium]